MTWKKEQRAESVHTDQYPQLDATQDLLIQGWWIFNKTVEVVPDSSLAYLLLQMRQLHVEIFQLLDSDKRRVHKSKAIGDLHWNLNTLRVAQVSNLTQDPIGQLLDYQHDLLRRLIKTIQFQEDKALVYQLSSSVAALQVLHDQLVELRGLGRC